MKARVLFLVSAAVVLLAFHAYGRTLRNYYELSTTLPAMDGVEIEIKGYETNRQAFGKAVDEMRVRFEELEGRLSRFRPGSDVSKVNEEGASTPVPVDPVTFSLLEKSLRVSEASDGAFDASILPVIQLWKKAGQEGRVPDAAAVASAKALVAYRAIALDPVKRTIRIQPGMGLDLGGIAQGLFADEGIAILRRHGIRRGLVNASGEVAVYDDRPAPESFSIAILDPLTGKSGQTVKLTKGAVATSGGYYRFVEIAGHKYSHILDPRTGKPADGTVSITVQAPTATEADAWSTACAVLASRGQDPSKSLPAGFQAWGVVLNAPQSNDQDQGGSK